MLAKFGQDSLDLPDKNTCIPYIVPIGEIALRCDQIGFLDETLCKKSMMSVTIAYLIGKTDIAIACLWCCRLDAYGDQISLFRQIICQMKCVPKCFNFCDHVISAEDSHNRFWISAGDGSSGPGDGRCRITAHWFEQN